MSPVDDDDRIAELQRRFHDAFPVDPVPPYPPNLGLDPLGQRDEYAGFADRRWPEVEPQHLGSLGFDICAAIGFGIESPPHLLNYYVPAFLTAALVHDREHEILDSILWAMRDRLPGPPAEDAGLPWWAGDSHFANYSRAQCTCIVGYLEFIREDSRLDCKPNCVRRWHYDWQPRDERMLEAWRARVAASEVDPHRREHDQHRKP